MSLRDLATNPDFIEYQKVLERRLVSHLISLHHLLASPTGTQDDEVWLAARLNTARALIQELEIILSIPLTHSKETVTEERKKRTSSLLAMLRRVFGVSDNAGHSPSTQP